MEQDLAPFNEGPENGPDQRVIALVNSYIVHTTGLLNNYAAWSEVELVNIHERISELDATLRLLEAQILGAEVSQAADAGDQGNVKTQMEAAESSAASTVGESVEEIDLRNEDFVVSQNPTEAKVVDPTTAFVEMLKATTAAGPQL